MTQTVPTITLFHICISKKAILIRLKMPLYSKQWIKDDGEMRKENHSDPLEGPCVPSKANELQKTVLIKWKLKVLEIISLKLFMSLTL